MYFLEFNKEINGTCQCNMFITTSNYAQHGKITNESINSHNNEDSSRQIKNSFYYKIFQEINNSNNGEHASRKPINKSPKV